jgi:transglutaminase-like putative cysteine protease
MKLKRITSIVFIMFMVLLLFASAGCGGGSAGEDDTAAAGLAEQARAEQAEGNFTTASELYGQAREAYLSEGDEAAARECLDQVQIMSLIALTYSIGEDDLRGQLAQAFPGVSDDEREGWIASGELEHMIIDGEPMYFDSVIPNIKFRDVDLFHQDAEMLSHYESGYQMLLQIIDEPGGPSWQPFVNPITYRGIHTLDVPREKLPDEGLLKIWFPIPIITGPQPEVRVTAITPDTYVAEPPSIDGDIGVVYMEVPLDELAEDLKLSVEFEFEHHEQRFTVDPAQVGEYDTESALYKEYTASAGNILVTPEIEDAAREAVGDETNPYLAAKRIYDYVVDDITYSFMPHSALWPRGKAESVYVHENRFGDCGAQSMYFSSLCRAVGIPARTTGGWQLFSGNFAGHFWAEFYVPGYGWVPVDPTAADLADYVPGLSEAEVRRFKDFFFANQDHFRCVVQRNVDVPLVPPAAQPIIINLALQQPASNCDTMLEMPDLTINDYWSFSAQVLSE